MKSASRQIALNAGSESRGANRGRSRFASGLLLAALPAILAVDHLFAPALIDLVEDITGKFPTLEIVLRTHFLLIFFQVLLIFGYLLFVDPVRDLRKRIVLYILTAESLVLCAIWIFDRPDHLFFTESSALTFFSALFLMLCALCALLNALYLKFQTEQGRFPLLFWSSMAAAFLFASIDEFFMIHERVSAMIHDENWVNDMATGLYAAGGVVLTAACYKTFRDHQLWKRAYFFRTFLAAIGALVLAVALDTFDFLFRPLDPYLRTFNLLNSIEEFLEFTAAALFLCAFVLNLFEADDSRLLRFAGPPLEKKRPGRVRRWYGGFLLLSLLALLGIRFAYSGGDGGVILEQGYRATVFADISGGLDTPDGLAYDRDLGFIVGSGYRTRYLLAFDGSGRGSLFADTGTGLVSPEGLGVRQGALFVADAGAGKVLRYDAPEAPPAVVAEKGLKSPRALAVDTSGTLYIGDGKLALVIKQTGDRSEVLASSMDGLRSPAEMALDGQGNLYVTDDMAGAVFRIDPSGETSIFADRSAGLVSPEGIAVHEQKIYVTDGRAGRIYRFDPDGAGGKLLTFGKKYRRLSGIVFDDRGAMYVLASDPYSSSGSIFRIERDE